MADADTLRTRHVGVRMNEAEYTVLAMRAQAAGYGEISSYIRVVALRNQAPAERKVPHVNFHTWGSLGKLSATLNQLLAHLQRGNVIDREQGARLEELLVELRREIGQVRVVLLGGTAEDLR